LRERITSNFYVDMDKYKGLSEAYNAEIHGELAPDPSLTQALLAGLFYC